jgi:hypothetical protein
VQFLGGEMIFIRALAPSRRSSKALDRSSSHTTGAAIRLSHSIGRDAIVAIGSGALSAICLGTSSPTTRLR